MKVFFVVLCFILSSCKNQKEVANLKVEQDSGLTLLVQDNHFFTEAMETEVIRDDKTLRSFFSRVNKTRKPGLSVPSVDFENEMVLTVCMGEQKNGKAPLLQVLENNESELVLGIITKETAKTNTTTISYPFCVYKMPISRKEIRFQ